MSEETLTSSTHHNTNNIQPKEKRPGTASASGVPGFMLRAEAADTAVARPTGKSDAGAVWRARHRQSSPSFRLSSYSEQLEMKGNMDCEEKEQMIKERGGTQGHIYGPHLFQ